MIGQLVEILRRASPGLTAEELADVLWLARTLDSHTSHNPPEHLRESRGKSPEKRWEDETSASDPSNPKQPSADLHQAPSAPDAPMPDASAPMAPGMAIKSIPRLDARRGLIFPSPAAPALPQALDISRALRPLMRRANSRTSFVLDEEATSRRIAERNPFPIRLLPAAARWLDAVVLIDQAATMSIWQQTVNELVSVFERQGAFRRVLRRIMVTDDNIGVSLFVQQLGGARRSVSPSELVDPGGQRVIMVVSDCIARCWDDGRMAGLFDELGRHAPVVIVQVLPAHLWHRSGVESAVRLGLRTRAPATRNHDLVVDRERASVMMDLAPKEVVPVPIMDLGRQSMEAWANFIAGPRGSRVPGVGLRTMRGGDAVEQDGLDPYTSAVDRVSWFRATSTPLAKRLATLFAAANYLSLPVMRHIWQSMLPESNLGHLAEVFMGGLLYEIDDGCTGKDPEYVRYDFHEGVREILLDGIDMHSMTRVLQRVSDHVTEQLGYTTSFRALLLDPNGDSGMALIPEQEKPFARIGAKVLQRLGGPYGALARRLEVASAPDAHLAGGTPIGNTGKESNGIQAVESETARSPGAVGADGNTTDNGRTWRHEPQRDTVRDQIVQELVNTLATLAQDSDSAKAIIRQAGFPPETLCPFVKALDFWSEVVERAELGGVSAEALLAGAITLFPYNLELSEIRRKISGTPASPSRQPEKELPEVLAALLSREDEARHLLLSVGFPDELLPQFLTAEIFWHRTLELANMGVFEDPTRTILRAALEQYPFNEDLTRINDSLSLPPPGIVSDVPLVPEPELRRYRAKAHSLHRRVQFVGFTPKMRVPIEIEELHVPLYVTIDRAVRGRDIYCSDQLDEVDERRNSDTRRAAVTLWEALHQTWSANTRAVVLLGDPGSGKTTVLKQVLLQTLAQGPEAIGLPTDATPVFLSLKSLRDRTAGLPEFIQQELHSPLEDLDKDFGQRLCRRGRILFILDGLDEVAAEEQAGVARWIEQAHRHAPDSYFLVSSRYAAYSENVEFDEAFLELHLRPLRGHQVQEFVMRWYNCIERATTTDPRYAEGESERKASELLQMLWGTGSVANARITEMMRNPLLLTLICLVHGEGMIRPPTELYDQVIGALLARGRARSPRLPGVRVSLALLRSLAWWMHQHVGRTRVDRDELDEPLEQFLSRLSPMTMDVDASLQALRDESGLLSRRGPNELAFVSLGLQEYLAAQYVREHSLGQPTLFLTLGERFDDGWWHEVILMMLSTAEPSVFNQFMRVVVQQPGFVHWAKSEMMFRCLHQSKHASVDPFAEEILKQPPPSSNGELLGAKQLAALDLIRGEWPEELRALGPALSDHPTTAVRAWWREFMRREPDHHEVRAPRGGVELVRVPGGRFTMGSSWRDGDRDEHPQHEVELDAFYMARTPVTNAQYAVYLTANTTAVHPKLWDDERFNQPTQPVVGVSWNDALAYCEWAGLMLPTEAQWEYACRAGTRTRSWAGDGDDDLERVGWCFANSNERLQPVRMKGDNLFGLFDMHGNIWEWCRDGYGSYEVGPREGDGLRYEPASDGHRVRRGGGFRALASFARSAIRGWWRPDQRCDDLGFRPIQALRVLSPSGDLDS